MTLLPVKDVARQLGIKDPKTIKRWLAEGKLAGVRLGDSRSGHLRVDQQELDRFVERCSTVPAPLPLAAARGRLQAMGRRGKWAAP